MRKTINIEPFDLEDGDTVCGYRVKDLIIMAKTLQQENITAKDLRKFVNNLEFAYEVIENDFKKQLNESMIRISEERE